MLILLQILATLSWAGSGHGPDVTLFCTSQQVGDKVARITWRQTDHRGILKHQVYVEHGGRIEGDGALSYLFDQSQVTTHIIPETKQELVQDVFVAKVIFKSKNGEVLGLPDLQELSAWMICNLYLPR